MENSPLQRVARNSKGETKTFRNLLDKQVEDGICINRTTELSGDEKVCSPLKEFPIECSQLNLVFDSRTLYSLFRFNFCDDIRTLT